MAGMRVLPFEGQAGTHVMYRDIKLHLAAESIDKGKYAEALERISEAREYPWRLGVGKPYDELIDTTLEDWLSAIVYHRTGNTEKASEHLAEVRNEALLEAYPGMVTETGGRYADVMSMLGNLDASSDKKLF